MDDSMTKMTKHSFCNVGPNKRIMLIQKIVPGTFSFVSVRRLGKLLGNIWGKNKIVLEPNQNVCIFMYLHREQPILNICQVLAVFCVSLNAYLLILLHQQVPDGSEFSPTEVSFFYSLILC